jgi:hypothetical protein
MEDRQQRAPKGELVVERPSGAGGVRDPRGSGLDKPTLQQQLEFSSPDREVRRFKKTYLSVCRCDLSSPPEPTSKLNVSAGMMRRLSPPLRSKESLIDQLKKNPDGVGEFRRREHTSTVRARSFRRRRSAVREAEHDPLR